MKRGAAAAARVLALVLVLAAPVADAHPWGRSTFERHESAGVAFLFAVVPDVPRTGHAIPVHVELRDAANGTLLDARAVNATLREPAGPARALALAAEGPGRFAANVTVPAPGEWVVDVAWPERNAGAAFAFRVFPDHAYRVDWLPMALEYAQAGVAGNVSAAVRDESTGRVLSPLPADALLVVEAWSDLHEERLGRWEVPFPPSAEDTRLLATSFTWPRAGAFDLYAIVPSLGITEATQPAFDVHASNDPAPWVVRDAVTTAPERATPAAPALAAVTVGIALAGAFRRRG